MSTRMRFSPALAIVIGVVLTDAARADVITQWNEQVFAVGGPQIQRTLAMVHIAMFDAVNAIQPRYTPYLQGLPAPPAGASAEAAAAAAGHGVLLRLFPAQQAALAAALAASLAAVDDGPAETDGVAFGDAVAAAMYQLRLTDNMLAPGPVYAPGPDPGDYVLTTPGPPQPVNTGAASWVPFALTTASQFRPNGPAPLKSATYARDVDETSRLGGVTSTVRQAEEDEVARWHTEQAQFQFNRIARQETATDGRSLRAHARLFALLNIALADAVTAVFEAKYHYAFWRPSTAIRNADIDGNRRTSADPGWSPFLTTPPHPEYPAAHGAVQGAGAFVLARYFGQHYAFETTSPTVPGVTRQYASFKAFADEGFMARLYGGMHFRHSLDDGARQGRRVAGWVLERYLRP